MAVPFNTLTPPANSANPLNNLAYAEETRNTGVTATGGIFQLTPQMWATYAPKVGINTTLNPTPSSATGVEQRAVAATIYNEFGYTPFIEAHPGIAGRLPNSGGLPQTVPIWGGSNYLTSLQSSAEGSFFDPFGVGASTVPTTAIGSVGPNAQLEYAGGTKITAGSTLTGTVPAATNATSNLTATTSPTTGSSDPFANIPSSYSEPSTGTDTSQSSSGGLSQLAAGILSPAVDWAKNHLVIAAILILVVGGFFAYHGLLGEKFETFVKRFV